MSGKRRKRYSAKELERMRETASQIKSAGKGMVRSELFPPVRERHEWVGRYSVGHPGTGKKRLNA